MPARRAAAFNVTWSGYRGTYVAEAATKSEPHGMIDAMYKTWPKCPICSRPMLLSGEVTLDKDGKPSSGFACNFCRAQPKPVSPVFGFLTTDEKDGD